MKCEFLLTYHADLAPAVEVGGGPFGTRVFFEVKGGTFEGPRLRGKILSGGGDWLLIDAEGVARLDVRAVFETDDGAAIYVQFPGCSSWIPRRGRRSPADRRPPMVILAGSRSSASKPVTPVTHSSTE
jgi:Protein of unknown function (DUF3237)